MELGFLYGWDWGCGWGLGLWSGLGLIAWPPIVERVEKRARGLQPLREHL